MRRLTFVAWGTGIAVALLRARTWQLTWGATREEAVGLLDGDGFFPDAQVCATRGISIDAPAAEVWPWIAQLGQERSGFYSYVALENLVGCQIHDPGTIEPAWQNVEVGDPFLLHPDVALEVAAVRPGEALVLRGVEDPGTDRPMGYGYTWAFVLQDQPDGSSRLLVRERYRSGGGFGPRLAFEALTAVSFVMTQKTLREIKRRVEAARVSNGIVGSPAGDS
jgi:hypothetical protein